MDQVLRKVSAFRDERRNKILIAALAIGVCLIVIVSVAASSNAQGDKEFVRPCQDNGLIKLNKFEIEGLPLGEKGYLAKQGQEFEVTVEFEPKQVIEKVILFQELKAHYKWMLVGTATKGLKWPVMPGVAQTFKSSWTMDVEERYNKMDYRLVLGWWQNKEGEKFEANMCVEFTMELDTAKMNAPKPVHWIKQ